MSAKHYHFKPRTGSRISNEQAKRYGEYLYAVGKRRKKGITADELVDLANDPENPCHDAFQWEDTAAAREFRLIQARTLLRSIVVVYGNSGKGIEDIAFHHVPVAGRQREKVSHAYVPVEQIVRSEETISHVVAEYKRRIRALTRDMKRHERFADAFGDVIAQLENVAVTMEDMAEV